MPKSNGTDAATVSLQHLALEAWINRNSRQGNVVEDGVFACYLRAQESPQAYRYLRRWLADNWDEARLVSYGEISSSLSEDRVIGSLKGKGLDGITEIVTRAQNAKRDLNKAFDAYREVLSGTVTPAPSANGGKKGARKTPQHKPSNDKPAASPGGTVSPSAGSGDKRTV